MRLNCYRQPLLEALQTAADATARKSDKLALQSVHAEADAKTGTLRLSATDTEVFFSVSMEAPDAEVLQGGTALFPPILWASLKESRSPRVELVATSTSVLAAVSDSANNWKFNTADVKDFPLEAWPEASKSFAIDGRLLASLVERVSFACAAESMRYAMNGVLFDVSEQGGLTLVGTDGKRVAAASAGAGAEARAANNGCVVPTRALGRKLLPAVVKAAGDGGVSVALEPSWASFSAGGACLRTRLLEGRYPAWRQVFPAAPGQAIGLEAEALAGAVRLVAVTADPQSPRMEVALAGDRLTLKSSGPSGDGESECPADNGGGAAWSLWLDPSLISDFLSRAPGRLDCHVSAPTAAVLFRAGADYQYLVMPLA